MNAALIDLIRHHAAPAVNAVGGAVGNIASPANQQYALKRGIGSMLKHPALPLAAAGLLLPMAALEFDRSAINDQNAAKWNAQQEMGRGSEMGDFSKNSALRKMAVEVATTKIAGLTNALMGGGLIGGFTGKSPLTESAKMLGNIGKGVQKLPIGPKIAGIFDSMKSLAMNPDIAQQFYSGGAKALGAGVAGGGMALAAKGIMSLVNHLTQPSATTILKHLMQDDPIISKANPTRVMEAYISLKRFAPTLSTDMNATRSYLREALTLGSGPDFSTLANLAKAEKSVSGGGGKGDK